MIKSSNPDKSIIVIANDIRSTHNIGSLFRTCEGLGIDKLIISGYSPYPKSKKDKRLPHLATKNSRAINKTSLDAEKTLKWSRVESLQDEVNSLKASGYEIVALEQTKHSLPITSYKPAKKLALVLGNEVNGIDKETLSLCDKAIEIPMAGKKESFNVVQAAAISLFYLTISDN